MLFGLFKKKVVIYKYVLYEGYLFTFKQTVFDTFEEARAKATFKSSIYKVREEVLDKIQDLDPFDAEHYILHNKCGQLVFIGSYDKIYRPGAWA